MKRLDTACTQHAHAWDASVHARLTIGSGTARRIREAAFLSDHMPVVTLRRPG